MYERSGGSMSIEERLANRGATTHVESTITGLAMLEFPAHSIASGRSWNSLLAGRKILPLLS